MPRGTAHSMQALHAKHATAGHAHTAGAALLHNIIISAADHDAPGKAWCLSAWLHLQERLYLEGPLCSNTALEGAEIGRHSYSGRMELRRGQLSDLLSLINPA